MMNQELSAARLCSPMFAAAISAISLAGPAWAIPNSHLNPHPHDAGKVDSSQVPLGNPDTINHEHVDGIAVNYDSSLLQGTNWLSFGNWDDRFYRESTQTGGTSAQYGHGYVDPSFRPRYGFANDVAGEAQALIDQGLAAWDVAAKQEGQNTRTTPDGTPLRTSVVMENVGVDPVSSEWTIDFIEGFEESGSAFAEWCSVAGQCAGVNPLTLVFESTPTNQIFFDNAPVNDDWELRVDGGAWLTSYTETVGWSLDKTPNVLGVRDVDYRSPGGTIWEGTEPGFPALGLGITTNTFFDLGSPDAVVFYEMDFFTIALHELGHVIGLLHEPSSQSGAAGSIMRSEIAFDAAFGPPLLQQIDTASAKGAAVLYSIPLAKDYGDAPDSYQTLLASNGPRYDEGDQQRLGLRWDSEPDGQPTPLADGDDFNLLGVGGPDDEDGVQFGDSEVWVTLDITRPGLNTYLLDAWWDLNENGIFDHAGELIIDAAIELDAGIYDFHFGVPFDPREFYSRFRLTWVDDPTGSLGGVSLSTDITPFGEFMAAAGGSHGEVEDYPPIPEPATLVLFAFGGLMLVKRRRQSA